jgi:hypothetical protein
MATNTAGTVARELSFQAIHYLRLDIDEASGVGPFTIGVIPAGSVILKPISGVQVNVAFSGTSPVLDIGTAANDDLYGTDLDLDAAVDFVPLDEAVTMKVAVDTELIATIDLDTPAGAEDGAATIIIAYCPDI